MVYAESLDFIETSRKNEKVNENNLKGMIT